MPRAFALLLGSALLAVLIWPTPPPAQAQAVAPLVRATPSTTPAHFIRRPPPLTIGRPFLRPGQSQFARETAAADQLVGAPPAYHLVQPGDTSSLIAETYRIDLAELIKLNALSNPDRLSAGAVLRIPGGVGGEELLAKLTASAAAGAAVSALRGSITEQLTLRAQEAAAANPFYCSTWLTYYGRPNVPILGILGDHDLDALTRLLAAQARRYDQANGPALQVMPAYHLVYGMATRAPGDDGSHLIYLSEQETLAYIERAAAEGFGVILDIQVGARTPVSATAAAFPFLRYAHVHLVGAQGKREGAN